MAVLAPSDWQLNTMDLNARQQRSSPANDPSSSSSPHHHQHTQQPQPYSYPVQQQPQGSWTPSIAAQPFYPSFYPPQQPQPYPQLPQQPPYFDPANAQLAQWAYQQMVYNAQQGFMPHQQQQRSSPGRNAQGPSPTEYFAAQNQMNPMFNPFPSGTPPPPHPHRTPSVDQGQQPPNGGQYPPGFHPYRRPTGRQSSQQQQSSSPSPSQSVPDNNDWRSGGAPNPPYARPDASGSSSSVNSTGSGRPRTDSNQSSRSNRDAPPNGSVRGRNGSTTSAPPPAASGGPPSNRSSPSGSFSSSSSAPRNPHHRNLSSSSTNSSSTSSRPAGLSPSPPTTSTSTSSANSLPSSSTTPRPARPSPLSQGNFTASEKRMSRDDSDLQAMLESASGGASGPRSGLKGRLRRALTFNAAQSALKEEDDVDDDASIKASNLGSSSKLKAKTPALINSATSKSGANGTSTSENAADDAESTATIQTNTTKKRGRAASLFNSRLNASTDNISLSSTVSSASVMIRKLGSMGKLARRNSLAGITSLFKDKKNKESGEDDGSVSGKKKKKDKKSAKGEASEASVSHVTAELDRSSDWGGPEMSGLSPAAKLARQHTLKTNAEAAAKAKAQQEAAAAAAVANAANAGSKTFPNGNSAGVPTWEKNTATRQGSVSPVKGGGAVRVNEEVGDNIHAGWDDDDEDWNGEEDEDVTIRMGVERINVEEDLYDEPEPWAVDVRRSVERTRQPSKGILKNADKYDQAVYLSENVAANRVRSNSYNSHPSQEAAGPLARMPSPDPDHIDGLHRHGSHSSAHGASPTAPSLPSFSFEASTPSRSSFDAPRDSVDSTSTISHPHAPEKSMFSHSNSSAPVLSTIGNTAPTLTHRSATTPSKRLAFASNLSVYDTFSPSMYDRRSEPATWSRLTPALAQRIKEELNSYKMEEMEVHAASRIHTQFFV
ncbi:hypothetical protein VKT23_002881 [Stygiomarasmius scandens]|uniref:Protein BNI4 n=1 Tax=Marasmiellus scandens TaxID=2682957 RepID=A0ABR1JYL1_9AGAR